MVMLAVVRLYGLRTFAKMSSIDFATTIAVGSILASTVMSSQSSILKGVIALMAVIGFQQLFSFAKGLFPTLENMLENDPVYLMRNGEVITENLKKTGVTESNLQAKLREANVFNRSEIAAVILETTGDVSVLHTSEKGKKIENWIVTGIG